MNIMFFDLSLGEAERVLRRSEVEYLVVGHSLMEGEGVDIDAHKSNEWIILGPGRGACHIQIGDETQLINLSPKRTTVIFVPKGEVHSLEAITDLSYTIMRDGFN